LDGLRETTVYRAILSLHQWLVFCSTTSIDPESFAIIDRG
jgi:hypothetical protein